MSGQLRFFTYGDWPPPSNSPVQEFAIPDTAPSRTLASAPFLSLVKDWGDVRSGHIRTTTNDGSEPTFGNLPGGLHWDEARNALWWTYGSSYVPTESHPTVGATVLDDKAGTYQTFGPWRTEWNAQLTLGAMGQIPPAFAAAYTNGKSVGMMANQSAGNAGSPPHGAVLWRAVSTALSCKVWIKLSDPVTRSRWKTSRLLSKLPDAITIRPVGLTATSSAKSSPSVETEFETLEQPLFGSWST